MKKVSPSQVLEIVEVALANGAGKKAAENVVQTLTYALTPEQLAWLVVAAIEKKESQSE